MPACSSTLYLLIISLSLGNSTELFQRRVLFTRLGHNLQTTGGGKGVWGSEEGPGNLLFAFSFPILTFRKSLGLV